MLLGRMPGDALGSPSLYAALPSYTTLIAQYLDRFGPYRLQPYGLSPAPIAAPPAFPVPPPPVVQPIVRPPMPQATVAARLDRLRGGGDRDGPKASGTVSVGRVQARSPGFAGGAAADRGLHGGSQGPKAQGQANSGNRESMSRGIAGKNTARGGLSRGAGPHSQGGRRPQ